MDTSMCEPSPFFTQQQSGKNMGVGVHASSNIGNRATGFGWGFRVPVTDKNPLRFVSAGHTPLSR
jgi:hypothetical protein